MSTTPGPWFIEDHGLMDATRSRTICLFGDSDQDDADLALAASAPSLLAENQAWMNGVADFVEPMGFDREAACGPADLLPGLKSLGEIRDALVDLIDALHDELCHEVGQNAHVLEHVERADRLVNSGYIGTWF